MPFSSMPAAYDEKLPGFAAKILITSPIKSICSDIISVLRNADNFFYQKICNDRNYSAFLILRHYAMNSCTQRACEWFGIPTSWGYALRAHPRLCYCTLSACLFIRITPYCPRAATRYPSQNGKIRLNRYAPSSQIPLPRLGMGT